ncbi:MAG TPA: ankyrin repeat domain-containing protein [Phycisphaerae bacterium]|nr:ankyrin repeat domain-containing protein [Phycisphaerae bacterium]
MQPSEPRVTRRWVSAVGYLISGLGVVASAIGLLNLAGVLYAIAAIPSHSDAWIGWGFLLAPGVAILGGEVVLLLPLAVLFFLLARASVSSSLRRVALYSVIVAVAVSGTAQATLFGYFAYVSRQKESEFRQQSDFYKSGMDDALRSGDVEQVRQLISAHPRLVWERDYYGNTPLMLAVKQGDPAMVKMLLDCGADPNVTGWAGLPMPLHFAAEMGNADIVRLLLEYGADVNRGDGDSRTPLAYARAKGHREVAELLATKGGQPEDLGKLAWEAAYYGNVGQMQALVAKGLDIRAHSNLLHTAADGGKIAMLNYLLDQGADITYTIPHNGFTALHDAAMDGQTEACRLLIARGVPKDARIWSGESAVALAKEHGHAETAQVLVDLGVPE